MTGRPPSLAAAETRHEESLTSIVRIDSADHAVRPLSIAALILSLGYLGYGLTAVAQLVPSSAVGVALGTIVSVSVAGTLYAVIVAVAYRFWMGTD